LLEAAEISLVEVDLSGGDDNGVDVVFVLVVEVVGVAFDILNAKWLLKDIVTGLGY